MRKEEVRTTESIVGTVKSAIPTIAFIYDFDGTLSPGNMQEFGFIQALKKDPNEFWKENNKLSKDNDADSILCYMWLMLEKAKSEHISLKRESFRRFGSEIELFRGVREWFRLVNEYGSNIGLNIEHYINSSGLAEMIEGTSIAKEFKKIYACSYLYDVDEKAYWPAVAVNYTTKTQFLFKINKGVESVSDNEQINEFIEEGNRRIPFKHMVYFGDGQTDIPCMKLVKEKGGHSIAVYNPGKAEGHIGMESSGASGASETFRGAKKLIDDGRVNFVCPADYSEGKEIHNVVKTILDKILADHNFNLLLARHKSKSN